MSNLKVKINKINVRKLLKSKEMMEICKEHADATCQAAGSGYIVTTYVGKKRVNASVHTKSQKAKKDNLENNTLLKSLR